MLSWLEHKPTFLLYGYDVWERHIQHNDGYCFGLHENGNQHAQLEYTINRYQLENFFAYVLSR